MREQLSAQEYYEEGRSYNALGQRDKAYYALTRCLTLDADHPEARALLKRVKQALQPTAMRRIRIPEEKSDYVLFAKPVVTLGRKEDNDIVLMNTDVSRYHARIGIGHQICQLEDLESSNGTRLNGLRIQKTALLHDRDVIGIGANIRFEVSLQHCPTGGASIVFRPLDAAAGRPEQYILFSGDLLIGSASECDIQFKSVHAASLPYLFKIRYSTSHWYLYIHPHTTDVKFNGTSVSEYIVFTSGDVLSVAGLQLIFE